jgi:hypothetical protein
MEERDMRRAIRANAVGLALCLIGYTLSIHAGVPANLFELHGRGVQIVYSSSSLTGEPQLTYTTRHATRTFRGSEIAQEPSAIGLLVTVTTQFHPDVNFVTFSVLIPDVNIISGSERLATEALITTHSTPFVAPPGLAGPVQTYRRIKMRGTASAATFLAQSVQISGTVSLNACTTKASLGNCMSAFADAAIEVRDNGNNTVTTATTDSDGMFSADVAPGTYVVRVITHAVFPACPDTKVDIGDEGGTVLDILCTAIR